MKPKTVRELLISLGLTAGLGAAEPACGSSLVVSNPPPDSGYEVSNPPPPDSGYDTAAGGRGGTGGVSNPPPGGTFGGDAAAGNGGSGGVGGIGGTGGLAGSGFGGGNVFPPQPDASGTDLVGSPDADASADGSADSEADGHETD